MWINIIDYRGDDTVINSRGDSLFQYRTKYFLRQQDDFYHWKKAGHKFRCFTQHENRNSLFNDYGEYDDVVKIPRGSAAFSRNQVLDYYPVGTWIGIWDNDVSLYWDRLSAHEFVKNLDNICLQAQNNNIKSFVPFNPLVSPYLKNIPNPWTFSPQVVQNALIWCQVDVFRNDETLTTREDYDIGCQITLAGYKTARLENISLRSMVNGKSTIFKVNAYHEEYKKPGPKANPAGLLKWDAQLDRTDKYHQANQEIKSKYNLTLSEIEKRQKVLWIKNNFNKLFEEYNKSKNNFDALFE
jgi:hypothetical protein